MFTMPAVDEAQEYLRDIAEDMVSLFGISLAEAVARVNYQWDGLSFEEWPDLICHELPEYWAYRLYYEDVLSWDPAADRSQWVVREAPPVGSAYWTLGDSGCSP